MHDLWPEDIGPIPESKGPVIILREQASLLGKKTNNLVEAEVVQLEPSRPEPPIVAVQIEPSMFETRFNYAFLIVAPPLNNYRYKLFTISHGIDAYPVTIKSINTHFVVFISISLPTIARRFPDYDMLLASAKRSEETNLRDERRDESLSLNTSSCLTYYYTNYN